MRKRGFEILPSFAKRDIQLPQRGTAASAGYDLAAAEDVEIAPGAMALMPTGLKAYLPPDEVLVVAIRSSLALRRGLTLANGLGVIDADYYGPGDAGHIQVPLRNVGDTTVRITKGERIAQGIFLPYLTVDGDTAGEGVVREGGFGSTGRT